MLFSEKTPLTYIFVKEHKWRRSQFHSSALIATVTVSFFLLPKGKSESERVGLSNITEKNFGTESQKPFLVSEIWPFKVKFSARSNST